MDVCGDWCSCVVASSYVFMDGRGKKITWHGHMVHPIDRWLVCLSAGTCSIATNRPGLGIPSCLTINYHSKELQDMQTSQKVGHATLNFFTVLFLE
jgi:hypothetical protein